MTFEDISTALGQHLEGMTDIPIAWPNRPYTPDGNYIIFRMSPNGAEDRTLKGGRGYEFGFVLITVMTVAGQFAKESESISQQIKDGFPKALRLPAGNGSVVINADSERIDPFPDGNYWRQPMRVSWITDEN